jgi:signal peptide peptidase SppA
MKNNNVNEASICAGKNMQNAKKLCNWINCLTFEKWRNPKPSISVLRLGGVIGKVGAGQKGLTIEGLNEHIEEAFKKSNLSAVCLVINSPGGSPVQSELIAARIMALSKEKDVPVYAFVEDVAASGGYWLACAADEIYASKSSIVGSIGVISAGFGFQDAIKKMGVERRVYTQGLNKSVLDPFLPEKKSDIDILLKLQKNTHNHFINHVKSRRKGRLTQTDEILFNGEFWSGNIAEDFGLTWKSQLARRCGRPCRMALN